MERQTFLAEKHDCDLVLIEEVSGRDYANRPKYLQLLSLIEQGAVEEVLAVRSDRIGRDQHELEYFYGLCAKHDVRLTFIEEPELNSDSPYGRKLREEKAREAQAESQRISDRVARSYQVAEMAGNAIARRVPVGFRVIDKKYELDTLHPNHSNALAREKGVVIAEDRAARQLVLFFLRKQTLTGATTAWKDWLDSLEPINTARMERLKKYRRDYAGIYLRNPVVRGHTPFGIYRSELIEVPGQRKFKKRYRKAPESEWRLARNTHEGVIKPGEWSKIKKLLSKCADVGFAISRTRIPDDKPQSLASLLKCKDCCQSFIRSSNRYKDRYYVYYRCRSAGCQNRFTEEQVREMLIHKIVSHASELMAHLAGFQVKEVEPSPRLLELERHRDATQALFDQTREPSLLVAIDRFEKEIKTLQGVATEEKNINPRIVEAFANVTYWEQLDLTSLHQDLRGAVRTAWISSGEIVELILDF